MILGLLAQWIDTIVKAMFAALPQWSFDPTTNGYITAIFSYLLSLNHWLPIDTAVYCLGLWVVLWSIRGSIELFILIVNWVRGAGGSL